MRYVTASMNVGPPPERARSSAACMALETARRSLPSTRRPGTPYARAFTANVRDAVCRSAGTLIDQWLFWQTSTQGTFHTPAKFIAAWKSAWLVAPSPMKPMATAADLRARIAHAAPTACGICGPMHDDQLTW